MLANAKKLAVLTKDLKITHKKTLLQISKGAVA